LTLFEGWQIDPFGASSVIHEMYALMGFDATVVDRIDYKLKGFFKLIAKRTTSLSFLSEQWEQENKMEFVWEPSATYGSNLQIFTHAMDKYMYPTAISGVEVLIKSH